MGKWDKINGTLHVDVFDLNTSDLPPLKMYAAAAFLFQSRLCTRRRILSSHLLCPLTGPAVRFRLFSLFGLEWYVAAIRAFECGAASKRMQCINHTCMHACIHTYIRTLRTYIHTSMHACMHTCTHAYIRACNNDFQK